MFIHIGENMIVRSRDVVAILDRQLLDSSSIVNEFLKKRSHQLIELANGDTKSIIVTIDKIYYSPLSSNTLKKRAYYISERELPGEEEPTL